MRWARFRSSDGRIGFGVFEDAHISEYEGDLYGMPRPTGRTLAHGSVTLLSPCTPSKIVALWNNFHALREKLGKPPPLHPLFLIKPSTSVIGTDEPILRPAGYAGKIAYEGELGIVIGKHCKNISPDEARAHIFGYTCYNDVTRGDFYEEGAFGRSPYFVYGKTYEGFAPMGPYVVTDLDPSNLHLECRINGEVRQSHSTSDRLFTPEQLVSFVSHLGTLNPGDVISCGSPPGMSWMNDGDVCEIEIEGIGVLRNHVRARAG